MTRPEFHDCVEMLRSRDAMTYEDGYHWIQGYLLDHIDDLLELMATATDPTDRSRFVELVGDSKISKVIPYLEKELRHPNRVVRMWAFHSLAYFENPDVKAIAAEFAKQNSNEDFM